MKKVFSVFVIVFVIVTSASAQSLKDHGFDKLTNHQWNFQSTDAAFQQPYVDVDEWRDTPVRHRYIHGGFKSNGTRFSFYFPEEKQYEGRFFQYITPLPIDEYVTQHVTLPEYNSIAFSIESGAYYIETNEGGKLDMSNPMGSDTSIGAYRANAACATFSRLVAQEIYHRQHRPYGYCFGGSGGGYRTSGSMENTLGVWDGAVPYVMATPYAIPNFFACSMNAMRILAKKMPQIIDAMEPGGSGNPYENLNEQEAKALREITAIGFNPRSWYGYKSDGTGDTGALPLLYPTVAMLDPTYFSDDFWNKPGYEGHDNPEAFKGYRIQQENVITGALLQSEAIKLKLVNAPTTADQGTADKAWASAAERTLAETVGLSLKNPIEKVPFLGAELIILSGDAKGKALQITKAEQGKVIFAPTVTRQDISLLKPGDRVRIDNSNFLALQTYYRHQVPQDTTAWGWTQFLDKDKKPIYPQRPMLVGPVFARAAAGCIPNGNIHGKIILCYSMLDQGALPWQGDWYIQQVRKHLGSYTDANVCILFTDNALHGDHPEEIDDPTHAISYNGVLQQALRDLSRWVEQGIQPPHSSNYVVKDGQVVLPENARERQGIQPTIQWTVVKDSKNGVISHDGQRVDTRRGANVTLQAVVDIPAGTGSLVSAELAAESREYSPVDISNAEVSEDGSHVVFTVSHVFNKKGTWYPTLRIYSERNGNTTSHFAHIYNLARARVVVK